MQIEIQTLKLFWAFFYSLSLKKQGVASQGEVGVV
jgi:hypothetical protein